MLGCVCGLRLPGQRKAVDEDIDDESEDQRQGPPVGFSFFFFSCLCNGLGCSQTFGLLLSPKRCTLHLSGSENHRIGMARHRWKAS